MIIRALLCALMLPLAIPAASIEGIAVDHEGQPFPNVRLELQRLDWDSTSAHARAELIDVARADGEGRFAFHDLPEGGVYRVISPATIDQATGWHLPVVPGEGPIEVGITAAYRLALGILIEESGVPIEGATIWRRFEQMVPGHGLVMTVMASAETDADGVFALGPVIEPRVTPVEVELPDGTVFRASVEAREISEHDAEASVVIAPARETGVLRVVDAQSRPVGNVSVRLQRIEPDGSTGLITELISSASGEVVHGGLAPGDYSVRLTDGIHAVLGLRFTVDESDITPEVVLPFLGPGVISGRVLTTEDKPAPGVRVRAWSVQEGVTHNAYVVTDEDGRFTVEGLPLAETRVEPWPDERHEFAGEPPQQVILTEDEPHAEVAELPRLVPARLRSIMGHVRTPGGSGVEGAEVRLVPAAHDRLQRLTHVGVGGLIERTMDQSSVATGANGAFSIETDLLPDAIAAIWTQSENDEAGVLDLQRTQEHRWTEEELAEPLTLTLSELTTVTGEVSGQPLNPAERWEVQFFLNQAQTHWWEGRLEEQGLVPQDEDVLVGNLFLFSAQADEEGHFEIDLPRGTPWVARLRAQRLDWINSVAFEVPLMGDPEPLQLGEPPEVLSLPE